MIQKQIRIKVSKDAQPLSMNADGSIYLGAVTLQPGDVIDYLKDLPAAFAELNKINQVEDK
jgi:hypothetical protein